MDKTQAKEIVDAVLGLANRLDQSVKDVMVVATDRQAFDYRRLAGRMIAFLVTNLVRPALRHYPELEPESFTGPHVRRVDPPLDEAVARDVLLLVADVKRTAESFRFQQWTEARDAEEFREGIVELLRAAESAQAFIESNTRVASASSALDPQA